MRRELLAWIDDQLVGRLADENGIWSFQYESGWQAFGLCPQLPLQPEPLIDGSSQRPVQWYFDNLLPEEGQRQLLAQDARLEAADAFALLSWYGAESAGSLTLLAEGQRLPPGDRRPLSDADLSRRIKAKPQLPLTHEAHKRMSLAGASACPPRPSSCWNRPSGRIRFWPPRDRSCGQSSPASCAACGRSGR